MVEHTCEKCEKKFSRKDTFTKHINRLNSCTGQTYKNILEDNITTILNLLNQQTKETIALRLEMQELNTLVSNLQLKK